MISTSGSESPHETRGLYSMRPEQFDAIYAVGHLLFQAEDFVRAADVFRFLLLAEPDRTGTWLALGACHERLDEHDLAGALYETGFRIDNQAVELGLLAARARARTGDRQRARELLDDVAHSDPPEQTRIKARNIQTLLAAGEGP